MESANHADSLGLICRTTVTADGRIRLVMEDARKRGENSREWTVSNLYTEHDYDLRSFVDVELSERDLAEIGLCVVSRLMAFRETAHE